MAADPLSVAGSVVGIISLGLQVTQYLFDYYTAVKHQHSSVAHTTQRLERLLGILQSLRHQVDGRTYRADEQRLLCNIGSSVQQCEECIRELEDEVNKFKQKSADSVQAAVRITARRVAYPFRQSTLQKLDEDIDEIVAHLSLALQLLQQKDICYVQDDIEDARAILNLVRASQVSSTISEWLKAPDATINFNEACRKKHRGTGLWFVQGPYSTTWLQKPKSFLWLRGFAGCGKSVLCSTIIQHIFRYRRSNPQIGIAFFFFTFNDDGKQDASAMLRALVLQLSGQLDRSHTILSRLHSSYRNATPPDQALLGCLRQLVQAFRDVYIILDALDESPRAKHRGLTLEILNDMRAWLEPGLHLLVTSRDEPDIREELGELSEEIIAMRNDAVDRDIASFVSQRLRDDRRLRKWEEFYNRIESVLTERAKGVFRWVEFPELIDGIAVEIGDMPGFNAKRRLKDVDAIQQLCPGFIELDIDPRCQAATVQIAHFSIQEYLESESIRQSERTAPFAIKQQDAQAQIACGCYGTALQAASYSGCKDIVQVLLEKGADVNIRGGMYRTALQAASRGGHEEIVQLLLKKGANVNMPDVFYCGTALQEASYGGYKGIVQLLFEKGADVNMLGAGFRTALQGASCKGHIEIVQMLLEKGAFVNSTGGSHYGTALYEASSSGHKEIVELLLEKGADANLQDQEHRTALQAASYSGHKEIVQLLLEKGADANKCGGPFHGTALYEASSNGDIEIVQLLLGKGADTDGYRGEDALYVASSKGHKGVVELLLKNGANMGVALHGASFRGHREIVQLLLEKGADANMQNGHYGETALYKASFEGHEDVVHLLLEKGADANMQNGHYGETALHKASSEGHKEVVHLLLEKGADVNAQKIEYVTVLYKASCGGHKGVVQLLLEKGADIGAALHGASSEGHKEIVQLLLENGADVNLRARWYGTALHGASCEGHKEIAQLLLENGADVNVQAGWHGRESDKVLPSSYKSIVRLLFNEGVADTNGRGKEYKTALQVASSRGHEGIMQLLLEKGAKSD
ncbi:hypothetical protein DL765_004030 [Monosporascus sp. GIB2]|nr:hypothetical protein DL765_004030 [Monosporascus sp. GIB2]